MDDTTLAHRAEAHEVETIPVGAPGIGSIDYCWDCKVHLDDHSRIMTPEETR